MPHPAITRPLQLSEVSDELVLLARKAVADVIAMEKFFNAVASMKGESNPSTETYRLGSELHKIAKVLLHRNAEENPTEMLDKRCQEYVRQLPELELRNLALRFGYSAEESPSIIASEYRARLQWLVKAE